MKSIEPSIFDEEARKVYPSFGQTAWLGLISVLILAVIWVPAYLLADLNMDPAKYANNFAIYATSAAMYLVFPLYIYSRKKKYEPEFRFHIYTPKITTLLALLGFVIISTMFLAVVSVRLGLDVCNGLAEVMAFKADSNLWYNIPYHLFCTCFPTLILYGIIYDGLLQRYSFPITFLGGLLFMITSMGPAYLLIIIPHYLCGLYLLKRTGNCGYNLIWTFIFNLVLMISVNLMSAEEWSWMIYRLSEIQIAMLGVATALIAFFVYKRLPATSIYNKKNTYTSSYNI
ncbi:hypothetical protein ACE38W_20235 [Chitinophaga sp. Hz27]|uniref:hypothetical protein n=1 Tax=Chitinophaga sp. Hz27 TaxID=3347169 RepID=UPI0035D6576F